MSTITPKRIMAKRATSKRTMPNRSFSQSEIDRIDKLFAKPKMPKLPTIVVKFIISLLPETKPELLLNLYKSFIYYADANSSAEEAYEALYERAYYEDIQRYITYLAYPKLKSPMYFMFEPISKTLTDREVMYMVDLQLVPDRMMDDEDFHKDYYAWNFLSEFAKCNHLMKLQPEFKWTNLHPYNLKYIYALEEALLTRSKGLLYWLEKNFPTYVAMSAIYIYFKHGGFLGVVSPHDEKALPPHDDPTASGIAALFADDFFLDFLIRVNTKGHSGRPAKMLLRIAEEGICQMSLYINTKTTSINDPIRIKPNLKLYNKLLVAIQAEQRTAI